MKINDNLNVGQLNQSSQKNPVDNKSPEKGAVNQEHAGDSSRVSSLARQIANAKAVADGLPDVRGDKVALARKRLAAGYYDTPEAKEVLVDKLVSIIKDTSS